MALTQIQDRVSKALASTKRAALPTPGIATACRRRPRRDIGEHHAHAGADAGPLDLALRREHAVRPHQVADHAGSLLLGRLAAGDQDGIGPAGLGRPARSGTVTTQKEPAIGDGCQSREEAVGIDSWKRYVSQFTHAQ
jgi:hypothetical protein